MAVECPYCEKPLPDEHAACCGEVGHGTPSTSISPEAVEKLCRECELTAEPPLSADYAVSDLCDAVAMLRALRSALTASEKRVQELEMQSRGNWMDAEQLAAVIRHAVWEADNQAGVIDVDKLRAAMEKANG